MECFTGRSIIKGVADAWDHQYPPNGAHSQRHLDIGVALRKLNLARVTAKQIDDLIGNGSWTHRWCHECSTYTTRGVVFGSSENETFCILCAECISTAGKILEGV